MYDLIVIGAGPAGITASVYAARKKMNFLVISQDIGGQAAWSGEIKVNFRNETNIPGIFAAGDVTNVPEKQIIIAAGEGSKASLSAFRYLAERRFQ